MTPQPPLAPTVIGLGETLRALFPDGAVGGGAPGSVAVTLGEAGPFLIEGSGFEGSGFCPPALMLRAI